MILKQAPAKKLRSLKFQKKSRMDHTSRIYVAMLQNWPAISSPVSGGFDGVPLVIAFQFPHSNRQAEISSNYLPRIRGNVRGGARGESAPTEI